MQNRVLIIDDDDNIMGYISKLRKQIEPDPNNPTYIQTVKVRKAYDPILE